MYTFINTTLNILSSLVLFGSLGYVGWVYCTDFFKKRKNVSPFNKDNTLAYNLVTQGQKSAAASSITLQDATVTFKDDGVAVASSEWHVELLDEDGNVLNAKKSDLNLNVNVPHDWLPETETYWNKVVLYSTDGVLDTVTVVYPDGVHQTRMCEFI